MVTRRGFTLVELTIAVVLLAIGLLALSGALARALHETTRARAAHRALRIAESVVDSVAAVARPASGTLARAGIVVSWDVAPCALGECVRARAVADADTITLVARAGT